MACAGSRRAEAAAPPAGSSEYADFGTAAHVLFAKGLRFGVAAETLTNDPAVLQPLALSLKAAREILGPRAFLVEQRLPALDGLPEMWGTADVAGFSPLWLVDTIIDLKFGEGVLVDAKENLQLGIYALLAARSFGVTEDGVTAWILQPRCDHPDGLARRHHWTCAALDRLEQGVREAAAATIEPDAVRHAGAWCRWCAAAGTCAVRQAAPNIVPPAASRFFRPKPRWLFPVRSRGA